MLKKFQHYIDIVKVSDFDYGLWPGQYNIRFHACPKQKFHRGGAKDAEKEFFVCRIEDSGNRKRCRQTKRPPFFSDKAQRSLRLSGEPDLGRGE